VTRLIYLNQIFYAPTTMQCEMAAREFFVCFEGLDGVGKTTQIGLLQLAVESVVMKAPDRARETGKVLDKYLHGEIELPHQAVEHLFIANQWEINMEIESLINGDPNSSRDDAQPMRVVADRNFISGLAYGHARSGREYVERCIVPAYRGILVPDIIFYLVPESCSDGSAARAKIPDWLVARWIKRSGHCERTENVEMQEKVVYGYRYARDLVKGKTPDEPPFWHEIVVRETDCLSVTAKLILDKLAESVSLMDMHESRREPLHYF